MKRFVLVSSILALALAAPLMAQTEQNATGTVISSSGTQLVIKTDDGKQLTFMVDADTTGGTNLQAGSPVSVRYHDMNGMLHAGAVTANVGSGSTSSSASRTGSTSSTTGNTGSTPTGTSATGATAADRTRPMPDSTGNEASPTQRTTDTTAGTTTRSTAATDTTTRESGSTGTTAADTGRTRMPATASPFPLMGLSGLFALAGGLGARVLRRRT